MKLQADTFCAAPWFQIRVNNDGFYRACCVIDHKQSLYDGPTEYNLSDHSYREWMDSGYSQYLKQNLTHGNRLAECQRCWRSEINGQRSQRQTINHTVSNNDHVSNSWVGSYFARKQDWISDLLISADVKVSNLCNFACAMCNPMDSSKIYAIWKQQQGHPIVRSKLSIDSSYLDKARSILLGQNNIKFLQEVLEARPQHVKILGGEPLLHSDTRRVLAEVPRSTAEKINLLFVTNGSEDLLQAHQEFQHYRTVSFVVSLEGIADVQDYIRRGSCWNEISSNIVRYIDQFGSKNIYVHHTLQALSVQGLIDLMTWCSQHKVCLSCGVLDNPAYMSLRSVPSTVLNAVAHELECSPIVVQVPPYSDVPLFDKQALILMLRQQQHDAENLSRLREFVQWYDPDQRWKIQIPHYSTWLG